MDTEPDVKLKLRDTPLPEGWTRPVEIEEDDPVPTDFPGQLAPAPRVQVLRFRAGRDWLTANGGRGTHPAAHGREVKGWRADAAQWARFHKIKPVGQYPVRIICRIQLGTEPRGGARWDPLNWADTAKACVDGLRDAKILSDDTWRHVIGPDMRRDPQSGTGENVITFEIEEGYTGG
jgi:hypothetical protein